MLKEKSNVLRNPVYQNMKNSEGSKVLLSKNTLISEMFSFRS